MSREIKFRVWKENAKEWIQNNMLFEFACETCKFNEVFTDRNKYYGESFLTFQQFTGLLDKNGVEIYEGDILSFSPERQGKTYAVEFWPEFGYVAKHAESSRVDDNSHEFITSHFFAAFQWDHYHDVEYQYEVIGNIFQNPELLKL